MARKSLDISKLKGKSWADLKKKLEAAGFWVDHYHGLLETENEAGEKFQDLIHIDASSRMMDSTLTGVGSEHPEDFLNLNADEWHE